MADFSITLLDFTFSFHAIMNITVNNLIKIYLSAKKKKEMPRAGFEPTISSLLVTRLTNLAIKA